MTHDCPQYRRCRGVTRRRVLSGIAAGAVTPLSGCLGSDESVEEISDPVSLDGTKSCDVCGMIIAETFGPNGQTFFGNEYPERRDGPAWYDSVAEQYADRLRQERRGNDTVAAYVTDYSVVDYGFETVDGVRYITGHVATETFVRASEAAFVVDSDVEGAMGPDLLPFADRSAATAFVAEHGGTVVDESAITDEVLGTLDSQS